MVSPFTQPDFTAQTNTQYKANIDSSIASLARRAASFAPSAQSTPNMTVLVAKGSLWDGSTLTEVAAQSTGAISAPTVNPRIDRVVVDTSTGAVSIIAGTEDASPVAPAITSGKLPVAQVALVVGQSSITNASITDERSPITSAGGSSGSAADAITYDNSTSGLTATDVQAAIDEVEARVGVNEGDISSLTSSVSAINTRLPAYAADTGSADAYAIAPSPSISAYAAGQIYSLKPAHANTGVACTIDVSGLSAISVKMQDGSDPPSGALLTTGAYDLFNDGTDAILMNPSVAISSLKAGIPQLSKSTAYTCVLADANTHILHPSADTTARTFTIPANSSVAYPLGTSLTFVNQDSAGDVTIAITTDTMRLAGAGTTGSRTLAANGIATALKITATEWIISGQGLS